MNKLKLIISFLVIIGSLIIGSCSKDVGLESSAEPYKLPYNLSVEVEDDVPVVISSQKEFDRLFGDIKGSVKNINFKNHSLIYIQGKSKNCITDIRTSWVQADLSYKLEIIIDNNNILSEYREWCVGFIISKSVEKHVDVRVHYTSLSK